MNWYERIKSLRGKHVAVTIGSHRLQGYVGDAQLDHFELLAYEGGSSDFIAYTAIDFMGENG